jgi:hypothetical protein
MSLQPLTPVIQRQPTSTPLGSSAARNEGSALSLIPSGSELKDATEVMAAVQAVRSSTTASGLYTTQFRGKTISLTKAQRDQLYATASTAIKKNLARARQKAQSAKSGYEIQTKIDEEHWLVAPIVKTFAGVRSKVPLLLAAVQRAEGSADATEKALQTNDYIRAAQLLAECETAAIQASTLWREYHEGIISSGEKTVTVLEYTRDASFVTLGVLAVIATGGAAAGATTSAFGLEVGTVSAANVIATGAPIVATVAGAGVQAALGDKVDWAKVGVDVAVNLILSRFGGKLSHGIYKSMLGNPAVRKVGEVAFSRICSSILTHEASTAFTVAVDAIYRRFKGENLTWDQFTNELIARVADPKGVFVAAIMGAVVTAADVRSGGSRSVPTRDVADHDAVTKKVPAPATSTAAAGTTSEGTPAATTPVKEPVAAAKASTKPEEALGSLKAEPRAVPHGEEPVTGERSVAPPATKPSEAARKLPDHPEQVPKPSDGASPLDLETARSVSTPQSQNGKSTLSEPARIPSKSGLPAVNKPAAPGQEQGKLLDARIAEAEAELNPARRKTVEYKARRAAEERSLKGGPSKAIWNVKERIWILKRLKAYPDRTILEQPRIVGVKMTDGTVKPTTTVAGKGRTPDFVEVRGTKTVAGDLKSAEEFKRSIAGGLKRPAKIEGEFRASSKVRQQHQVEERLLDEAREQSGKIVVEGRNVLTGKIETIEVDPANYSSEVITYEDVQPN